MANLIINPPPINSPMTTHSGHVSDQWAKWFSSINLTLSQFFGTRGVGGYSNYTAVFSLPTLSTTQRNTLKNLQNGDMIYNTDDNVPNVYVNGSWYTVTLT